MTNKTITFTDGSPIEVDRDGIIKVYSVFNIATIELDEACELLERHVVCFLCARTRLALESDLRRLGWHLDRFELCPDHASDRDTFSQAWARFDSEISEAFKL
jgi:hypothetical protein